MTITLEFTEKLAKEHDLQGLIILSIEKDGEIHWNTYGNTMKKCRALGLWAKNSFDACISIIPFQTVFGMNNNGKALSLTKDQLKQIDHIDPKLLRKMNGLLPKLNGEESPNEQV